MVIEEFCNYGNIRDYLNNNRDVFINEMKNSDEAKEFQEDNIKYILLNILNVFPSTLYIHRAFCLFLVSNVLLGCLQRDLIF